jgi:hypothetical protein
MFRILLMIFGITVTWPLFACTVPPEEPSAHEQLTVKIPDDVVTRVRRDADAFARLFDLEDTSSAREKTGLVLLTTALISERGPQNPCGYSSTLLAYYDEIVRRFGQDNDQVIRATVAEALTRKGFALLKGGASWSTGRPLAARAVFEEVERRFGKDDAHAIRVQYVRSLIGKGATWDEYDPEVEIAIYDDVAQRFGEDRFPGVRVQAADALRRKASVMREGIYWSRAKDLERRLRKHFEEDDIYFSNEELDRLEKCQKRDTRVLFGEIQKLFEENNNLGDRKQAIAMLLSKCREPNFRSVIAIYDEIDRRFGKDEDIDIQTMVLQALHDKKDIVEQREGKEAASTIYNEIVGRFGKEGQVNIHAWVSRQSDILFQRILEYSDQCFGGQDSYPDIQDESLLELYRMIAYTLLGEHTIASYDGIVRRFRANTAPGIQSFVFRGLYAKANILELHGDLDGAIMAHDEIERLYGVISPLKKGELLEKQGKIKSAILVYDEAERRFRDTGGNSELIAEVVKARAVAKARLAEQNSQNSSIGSGLE